MQFLMTLGMGGGGGAWMIRGRHGAGITVATKMVLDTDCQGGRLPAQSQSRPKMVPSACKITVATQMVLGRGPTDPGAGTDAEPNVKKKN